jgi:hypothetical protein
MQSSSASSGLPMDRSPRLRGRGRWPGARAARRREVGSGAAGCTVAPEAAARGPATGSVALSRGW